MCFKDLTPARQNIAQLFIYCVKLFTFQPIRIHLTFTFPIGTSHELHYHDIIKISLPFNDKISLVGYWIRPWLSFFPLVKKLCQMSSCQTQLQKCMDTGTSRSNSVTVEYTVPDFLKMSTCEFEVFRYNQFFWFESHKRQSSPVPDRVYLLLL